MARVTDFVDWTYIDQTAKDSLPLWSCISANQTSELQLADHISCSSVTRQDVECCWLWITWA